MTWIDRIVDVIGWRQEPAEDGWGQVEAELGVAVPTDFKELCRRFGPGSFSAYLYVLQPNDDHDSMSLLRTWRRYRQDVSDGDVMAEFLAPYGLYELDRGLGLIPWGADQTEGEYYWLAERSEEPDRWPVLARRDAIEPWHRFEMSTTEFIYRMLADPEFKPFTAADQPRRPFYLPYGQTISSAEEWEALTNPNRES